MYKVLDLFSGIGGFSLGLERAGGFKTVAFCEIEEFPRRVLAKHWPGVPIYDDVRTLTADRLAADGIAIDAICGGFPCQDVSVAGAGAGLAGERSGLWAQYGRLVRELRPRIVIVENVAALLGRGLGDVLGDLAALGYDAEWHCIPASYVGAHHLRDRVWIIAYPSSAGSRLAEYRSGGSARKQAGTLEPALVSPRDGPRGPTRAAPGTGKVSHTNRFPLVGAAIARQERAAWDVEPEVDRVVDGVPHRMVADELKGLGNAVVPQIPEIIGRAILEALRP